MKHGSPLRMFLVLCLGAATIGVILAVAYKGFYPKIEANRIAEERRAIFSVLDRATDYEPIEREVEEDGDMEIMRIFRGIGPDGATVGYAFIAEGPGFSAIITMMVGLNIETRKLTGLKVIAQLETPGLGTKIVADKFTGQFVGLAIDPKIEYLKNRIPDKPNQIQAVTGATISSVAVVKAINKRVKVIADLMKERVVEQVSEGDAGGE